MGPAPTTVVTAATGATSLDADQHGVPGWPMLIGGEACGALGGEWDEVLSPADGDLVLAHVPRGGEADLDRAVEAARDALPAWRAAHFSVRQRAILNIADALEERSESFATLTARDTGNAIRTQARPEAATLVSLFRYFGGLAGEFKGRTLPAGEDQLQYTRLEPIGVVGAILPWNSPLMIAAMKLPAALVAGNTVVVKPAEEAPLTILLLAQVMDQFLPPGVVNVVTGEGATVGAAIAAHPGIDKVTFTGSTVVGQQVAGVASGRLAHLSLELGGKSPSVVFPSAAAPGRISATLEGVILSTRFTRQGQSCTAGSRLFVHTDVYDEFLEALVAKVSAMRVGDPLDETTDMGAIINRKQHDSILAYVEEGRAQAGVHVALDGSQTVPEGLGGCFQGPTILANADNSWRVAQEEVFGPVLVVIPFTETNDAIAMANACHYGLAAYVWSGDIDEALAVAHRVDAGWVQVNQGGGQVIGQSYGGYKGSGIGREFSLEGAIESFTQTKQINVRLAHGG